MAEQINQLSDVYGVCGQPSPEQLQRAAQEGFQSVLNLRSPSEVGVTEDESQQAEKAGLSYANVPLDNTNPSLQQVHSALSALDRLPKPVLIHCGAGLRAGAIALIADAQANGFSLEQLIDKAKALNLLEQPHLQQFIRQYDTQDQ